MWKLWFELVWNSVLGCSVRFCSHGHLGLLYDKLRVHLGLAVVLGLPCILCNSK